MKELQRFKSASIYERIFKDNYCGEHQLTGEAIC